MRDAINITYSLNEYKATKEREEAVCAAHKLAVESCLNQIKYDLRDLLQDAPVWSVIKDSVVLEKNLSYNHALRIAEDNGCSVSILI